MSGVEPAVSFVRANGLRHHVLRWVPHGDAVAAPPLVLCHGFLDQSWSWREVAERLCAAGRLVLAFDWRGHGRSDRIGAGGYYHFPDYLLDLDELLPQLHDGPVHLVGHSMGGVAATLYAATRPERLCSLASVEGLGPEAVAVEQAPERARQWLEAVAAVRSAPPRPIASREEAARRMRLGNPELPAALLPRLLEHAVRPVPGRDEGFFWHFDPLHRTPAPMPFRTELFEAFARRLRIPVLLVQGERGHHPSDEARRLSAFPAEWTFRRVVPEAGHMVHWQAPERLAEWLLEHAEAAESRLGAPSG